MKAILLNNLKNWMPCQRPNPEKIEGHLVTLEQFNRVTHGQALWDAFGGVKFNELTHYFPNEPYENADQFAGWLEAYQANNCTMVYRNKASGDICGMATFMRIDAANGVIEVGAIAHAPSIQRLPITTEAQYLLMRHVFDDLKYRRYEWKLNNLNTPSHVAAKRLGFTYEGVFRHHMVAKGENRDTAWYAMLDHEWPQCKAAFEAWLADDNFGPDGRQIRRLEDIRAAFGEGLHI